MLVDHTQAGVEHSLRWDVVPVRIVGGRQHAKLSLLAWTTHVRIIVTSANLTDPGYRSNYEVAATIDLTPQEGDLNALGASLDFLGSLLAFVPGASAGLPAVQRADEFLEHVRKHTRRWTSDRRRSAVRQHLVFTMPEDGRRSPARSSLDEAVRLCRKRGGSPDEAWVASPFFDSDNETSAATTALCKLLARGVDRHICFCVPAIVDEAAAVPRLAAPRALVNTPPRYNATVSVELLPDHDGDGGVGGVVLRPAGSEDFPIPGQRLRIDWIEDEKLVLHQGVHHRALTLLERNPDRAAPELLPQPRQPGVELVGPLGQLEPFDRPARRRLDLHRVSLIAPVQPDVRR